MTASAPARPAPPSSSRRRRLVRGTGVAAAVAVLSGASYVAYQLKLGYDSLRCQGNLKEIELALYYYEDRHGTFPPAVTYGPDGKAWHSWRVLIMPYVWGGAGKEVHDRYRFDEPWDGPSNRLLASEFPTPPIFRCPVETGDDSCSYLAVVGERTMWPEDAAATFKDVTDDMARTLHVVEASGSGVHWMEPRDLRFDAMSFVVNGDAGLRSRHPGAANDVFVHGLPGRIGADTPPETLKSLLLRDDGGPQERP